MKTKISKVFSCCKYELGIFVLLCLQAFMNLRYFYMVGEFSRLYFLVDYSMGKASRLLVGSIVRLLTDNPTSEWIKNFSLIVLFITIFFTAIFVGKAIKRTDESLRTQVYIFAMFFVSGSFTMYNYSKFVGLLDIYMFIFAAFAAVFACNKYLRYLVPFLCVAGVFTHQTFAISYFPLVILIVFYLMITQEKKAGNVIVFAVTSAVTVAATLFCILKGPETMTVTFEEAAEIIMQRNKDVQLSDMNNLAFYLFNIAPEEIGLTPEQIADASLWDFLSTMGGFITKNKITLKGVISILLPVTMVLSFFYAIWIRCIKITESKAKRFVYACFIMFTVFIPVCCIVSTDYIRWVQAGMLTQFGLGFLMFTRKDEAFSKVMDEFKAFFSDKKLLLFAVYAAYAFSIQRNLGA